VRRSRLLWLALPLSLATLLSPTGGNAVPRAGQQALDVLRPGFQGEDSDAPGNYDARLGKVLPSATQKAVARRLGAVARWNEFGTPRSLYNFEGYLSEPKKGDPVAIARGWVRDNATLFRLTPELTDEAHLELVANNALYESPDHRRRLAGLKPLAKDDTLPHVVLFRQRFAGGIRAGNNGLLTVGLDRQNRVTYVSGSVTGDTRITNEKKVSARKAWTLAAANVGWTGVDVDDVTFTGKVVERKFNGLRVPGVSQLQHARLVGLPTPKDGVRLAWETNVVDNDRVAKKGQEPLAYITHVDTETGQVLLRWNAVQHLGHGLPTQVPDPRWKIFPNTPQLAEIGVKAPDDRETWCWSVAASGCTRVVGGSTGVRSKPQLKFAWDEEAADANAPGVPSGTSRGNDAWTTGSFVSHLTPDVPRESVYTPTRDYNHAFTDQWHMSNCNLSANYASTAQNDLDAAIINLFVNYGRMHDWSYYLGFIESTWNMQQTNFGEDHPDSGDAKGGDPEKGQAQAGAVAGSILFTGRDNANQITLQDGVPGVTNQYLWHPLQGAFYSPCVDGAFDMTVVGHEYGHAISNRMIGGPDAGIGGSDGPKMGEGWSDLMAMEYVNGYGFAPVADENPFAVGPYATGNKVSAIRNYGMNDSPLNYGQLLYDGNGQTGPHSDSEIWSAANFTVRQALIDKYQAQFPYENKQLQYDCADGLKDSKLCPGNRRWVQLMFDGFLLQEAASGMPEAAQAQLAGDKMRYGGANQKEIWRAYASRGLGTKAEEPGDPDWATPMENIEAQVRFRAVEVDGGGVPKEMFVHVGPYTARTTEAGIGKAGQPSGIREFVPGKYLFTARADGYGMYQFERTFEAGKSYVVDVPMRKNLASEFNGAEASGDGGNHSALIDDTEETNWAFLGAETTEDIEGKQVTVDLAGGEHLVKEIAVSALNRPQAEGDPYDSIAQNRFAALRSFEILVCNATAGGDCESDEGFKKIWTSPEDAFPSGRPRPTSENLRIRSFDVPDTEATHVRLRVLTNHCTGNPIYSAEQNPVGEEEFAEPDCVNGFTFAPLANTDPQPDDPPEANNTQKHRVRASELQVFSSVTPGTKETTPDDDDDDEGGTKIPTTGGSPVLPVAGLVMAAAAAAILRRRRTA
jgi:hypothetical protein